MHAAQRALRCKVACTVFWSERVSAVFAAQDSTAQSDNSSDEEEAGRSAAFGAKKSVKKQMHPLAPQQQPQKKKHKMQNAGNSDKP